MVLLCDRFFLFQATLEQNGFVSRLKYLEANSAQLSIGGSHPIELGRDDFSLLVSHLLIVLLRTIINLLSTSSILVLDGVHERFDSRNHKLLV